MQYKILSVCAVFSHAKARDQLTKLVNEAITSGWEPVGGIAVAGNAYLQAVIKRR
jgi:hypothetical protein